MAEQRERGSAIRMQFASCNTYSTITSGNGKPLKLLA
jgi:hypothetical protein